MKPFKNILAGIIIFSIAIAFSSCSKNNFSHNYKKRGTKASTIDPVAQKNAPLRKTFVISGNKKKILGQQKPKI